MLNKSVLLCFAACLPSLLMADFSYEQSTKMTGGAMMGVMRIAGAFSKQVREPIVATVAVKGNRMVHGSKDRATVIDLDSETITTIDYQKKTYSVMTFAEIDRAMADARSFSGITASNSANAAFRSRATWTIALIAATPYSTSCSGGTAGSATEALK